MKMFVKILIFLTLFGFIHPDICLQCICEHESGNLKIFYFFKLIFYIIKGCAPIGCNPDRGSLSCGYFQIKLMYYIDCGEPGKRAGESTESAWKRCSDDLNCATICVEVSLSKLLLFLLYLIFFIELF